MAEPRAGREFTGRHALFWFVGFFGVVISVNVGMAVVAGRSWTGLVVANSYVASQEFEEKRLAHEAQAAAGWLASFAYESGAATLSVVDGSGLAVDLGGVSLLVNRPVGGHDDQSLTLAPDATGAYVVPLTLAAGVWDVTVTAPQTPLGPFELHKRIRVEETAL